MADGPQRVQELMGHITCPVLSMAADFDKQCRVPSIQRTTDVRAPPFPVNEGETRPVERSRWAFSSLS
jgi:hypothetical protein